MAQMIENQRRHLIGFTTEPMWPGGLGLVILGGCWGGTPASIVAGAVAVDLRLSVTAQDHLALLDL
jgi:hypothetical protein